MTLTLPAPFADLRASAHTEYGRRKVSWALSEPGELYRCRYKAAWVEISEGNPWRGEPLWLSAHRRTGQTCVRESFTDKARQSLHDALVPPVARYGFDRLWWELHRVQTTVDRSNEAHALRVVEWWRAQADLAEMHRAGEVTFVSAVRDRGVEHRERVVPTHGHGSHWEPIAAQAFVDGEPVGWVTTHGQLIPDGSILEGGAVR